MERSFLTIRLVIAFLVTSVLFALDYKYEGSKNSNIYHFPTCKLQKMKVENLIIFNSAKEAEQKGYRPCQVCRPPEQD